MKLRHTISIIIICFAIGGLTFTSLFFYDYNTRIVMVEEVQEETGEDISSLESDTNPHFFHNWSELISSPSDIVFQAEISLSRLTAFKTSQGHFLDLIKPPIL